MTLPGLVRANNLNDVVDRERAWDNLGSSLATGDISIPAPSLDLNFATNKSLVDDISGNNLITFTRASVGAFVGSNGILQTAASGVPRFDHNPTTGESLGLLVEEARTNIWTRSEEFNDAAWNKNNVTVTPNAATAPDGTLTADKLIASATTAVHSLSRLKTIASPSWATIYVKAAEYTICDIYDLNIGGAFRVNLLTGATSASPLGGLQPGDRYGVDSVGNGWYRIRVGYSLSNATVNNPVHIYPNGGQSFTGDGTSGIFIWGAQLEAGSFPTSYIPTVASTVTRAADVASITGANFSGWYNQNTGTLFAAQRSDTIQDAYPTSTFVLSSSNANAHYIGMEVTNDYNRCYVYGNGLTGRPEPYGPVTPGTLTKNVLAYANNNVAAARNGGTVLTDTTVGLPIVEIDRATIGHSNNGGYQKRQHLSRLVYWPSRLNNISLQYITQPSITAINLYAFNYAINGKDVLALNAVRNASTRDFIFIKGLLSAAQPRLTAAAATTSSGLTLVANALPKLAPSSNGNYFFASGLTLSGVTTRINGTNALSIATSPFSGSTATAPLLFSELRPQANWRITEPMPSGTIASPEFAIPFETNNFVLFMKAGQN